MFWGDSIDMSVMSAVPMRSGMDLLKLAAAAAAAKACELTTHCPRQLTLAQWALESGWGAHQPGNNCFGIKTYKGDFGVEHVATWEVTHGQRVEQELDFATFPSLEACFEKHAELITNGQLFAPVWSNYQSHPDVDSLIAGVAPIYATDPAYASKLKSILSMPVVQKALAV